MKVAYLFQPLFSESQMLSVENSTKVSRSDWLVEIVCQCSTQEEILVSTEIEFDISLVLKKSCLRKLRTSPRKLLYYLAAIRSQIDANKARTVGIQLVIDLRKTSF